VLVEHGGPCSAERANPGRTSTFHSERTMQARYPWRRALGSRHPVGLHAKHARA
jgi:hypothetical protein